MSNQLSLVDILDLREYERERPGFLKEVIALKSLRRIALGPYISFVFENRTTVRFQIQEMARAEKMLSDVQIQTELDIYNPLVPAPGELSVTMFIELTSDEELRTWLSRLAGIEGAIALAIGEGDGAIAVPFELDPAHASQLSREEVTASVHYLKARLDDEARPRFGTERAAVTASHADYRYETVLTTATKASLTSDWTS